MANPLTKLVAAMVLIAGTSSLATVASAIPLANGLAIKNATPASAETVQWRRGWGYRGGWGWGGVGAGFVAGAVIGGALASPSTAMTPTTTPVLTPSLRAPAFTARRVPPTPFPLRRLREMRSRTACSGSSPTTPEAGLISATMAPGIPVPECFSAAAKGPLRAALFFMTAAGEPGYRIPAAARASPVSSKICMPVLARSTT